MGDTWDGPDRNNLSDEAFNLIVDSVRNIIDNVRPSRTFYTLEPMPWIFPDSPQSYIKLIEAIDRKAFGAHMDIVNMINCPSRYFMNGEFIKECFRILGDQIKSCHAKDIKMMPKLTVNLEETYPGNGSLDYIAYLSEINKLNQDIPLIIEHIDLPEEYTQAVRFIKQTARENNIQL